MLTKRKCVAGYSPQDLYAERWASANALPSSRFILKDRVMAEAEQPQIDDLKRLLQRLEQTAPEKDAAKAPQPPPLPKSAPADTEPVSPPSGRKDLSSVLPRPSTSLVAPEPRPEPKDRRPMLTWLVAGASTAALAVAALAGLQSSHVSRPTKPAAVRLDGTAVESAPRPAPMETAAASKAEPRVPAPVKAEAPPPVVADPAPAATALPPAPTPEPAAAPSSPPIQESPALRAAAPAQGRDKYESEARLDAYLERGQKLLDEGDLTAARSFFRRVAESGDPRGALAMGATYDAHYFSDLGIRTAQPDNTAAGEWYRRAMELGSKDALDRLERLDK